MHEEIPMPLIRASNISAVGLLAMALPAAALAASNTFVKAYSDLISNTTLQKDVTPYDVQNTSDGGYILLATSDCPFNTRTTQACLSAETGNSLGNWLVKTDSSGNPQWQEELGCFSLAAGDSTIGVSIQQTTDGGYIIGGGTVGCGEPPSCGGLSSLQCGIVQKLDSAGNLMWSKTYLIGPDGTGINSIKQTSDGGYVAAGGVYAPGPTSSAALVLKLDNSGNVQWQRTIGPSGSDTAVFNAIQLTSDGGYAATGSYYNFSAQCQPYECESGLVVKLDGSGDVQWQKELTAAAPVLTDAIIQASDGSYVVAGAWGGPDAGAARLLVKLDSSGNVVWQNGYQQEDSSGSVIYSVHQTAGGGYVLAGDGGDVPWIGKVDASGNQLWQHSYYQGNGLSQWFAASVLTQDGGVVAAGWSEDPTAKLGLLFVVKTDSSGLCGSCSDVHPATPVTTVNPGLAVPTLSLPVGTGNTPGMNSPSTTRPTAITSEKDC
jgi:hypothetical protein